MDEHAKTILQEPARPFSSSRNKWILVFDTHFRPFYELWDKTVCHAMTGIVQSNALPIIYTTRYGNHRSSAACKLAQMASIG